MHAYCLLWQTYCQTCIKQLSITTIIHGQFHAQKQFSKAIQKQLSTECKKTIIYSLRQLPDCQQVDVTQLTMAKMHVLCFRIRLLQALYSGTQSSAIIRVRMRVRVSTNRLYTKL